MRAVVWTKYGPPDVLQLQEIEKPVPKAGEVLIRTHASTVTAGDCEVRKLDLPVLLRLPMRAYVGITRPKRVTVLGQEFAGEVESVGTDVTRFEPGDKVFGQTDFSMGGYAEYVCVPEKADAGCVARMPANMTYEQAAAVPTGGLEALHYLKSANVRSGESLLVNGAGGSIGTAAVQIGKYYGAEVTAVDSAPKLDMLRSIGADHVIDYRREDFTESGETYDLIFDVPAKASYAGSLRSLEPGGRLLLANARLSLVVRGRRTSKKTDKQVLVGISSQDTENLLFLRELIEAGKLKTVIDRTYPLEQVADAHRYVETGQKLGNVVIDVVGASGPQEPEGRRSDDA